MRKAPWPQAPILDLEAPLVLCLAAGLLAAGGLLAQAPPPASAPAESETARWQIQTENPERGVYRLTATAEIHATADAILDVLSDYEGQCEADCPYWIPSVDASEVVHRAATDHGHRLLVWTRVEDVLDATYWSAVEIDRRPGELALRYSVPGADELAVLATPERPHEPYFHHQSGSWRLEPLENGRHRGCEGDGCGQHAGPFRVTTQVEAHSDRFLINLAPGQVLTGLERHARALLGHLAGLEEPAGSAGAGQHP